MDGYVDDDDYEDYDPIPDELPDDPDDFQPQGSREEDYDYESAAGYEGTAAALSSQCNQQNPTQPSVLRMKPLEKEPGSSLFACELCNKTFQVKHTVYRHIKEVHRRMIVFVDESGQEIESMNKPAIVFTCDECGEAFNTRRNLEGHKKGHARGQVLSSTSFTGSNGNNNNNNNNVSSSSSNNNNININSANNIINNNFGLEGDEDTLGDEFLDENEDEEDEDDDDDIGDRDGIDPEDFREAGDEADFLGAEDEEAEAEDEDDVGDTNELQTGEEQEEGATTSTGMGIPYRCPYGICPQFFATKDLMTTHLKTAHGVRLELVPLTAPRVRQAAPPPGFSQQNPVKLTASSSAPLPIIPTTSTNNYGEKRFPCTFRGCLSAFTRRDRLNQHIRIKHHTSAGTAAAVASSMPSVPQASSASSNHHPPLRLKIPVKSTTNEIADASRRLALAISASRSNGSSLYNNEDSSHLGRNGKPTMHPKKYACDFPGCDKAYTKGSHVKRHKLSAHPELFADNNSNQQSQSFDTSSDDKRSTQESLGYFDDDDDDDDEEEMDDDFPALQGYPSPPKRSAPVQSVNQGGSSRSRPRR